MPRVRTIQPAEAHLWLETFLSHSFGSQHAQQSAQLDLLGIAHDATAYPDDISETQLAALLLAWANRWIQPADWGRFAARVRKRRQKYRDGGE